MKSIIINTLTNITNTSNYYDINILFYHHLGKCTFGLGIRAESNATDEQHRRGNNRSFYRRSAISSV